VKVRQRLRSGRRAANELAVEDPEEELRWCQEEAALSENGATSKAAVGRG
jgi:hypothetical protein